MCIRDSPSRIAPTGTSASGVAPAGASALAILLRLLHLSLGIVTLVRVEVLVTTYLSLVSSARHAHERQETTRCKRNRHPYRKPANPFHSESPFYAPSTGKNSYARCH